MKANVHTVQGRREDYGFWEERIRRSQKGKVLDTQTSGGERKLNAEFTRDTFDGSQVLELRYEAYLPMAIRCTKSICLSARSSWNLHSIAVAHRLDLVSVGHTSVFIAVSAVHRAEALDACKFLIDKIKASVPIWKNEVYVN
ncbi:Molybdopterin synthase catalytic subunit [Camellia lanceoleosa]|uniref:Molybdopterin synthase catalytic subunit n=1 Tax=Camellia lanceoleosa TaxID=1840588 RepID=A0ACC0GMN5_9ERIC|nr:Molybdopterin synthase catalytic subunit [Camellia lanceoleosa]